MSSGLKCRRRVEFRDTDAAGMAHFSAFFVWMEQVEHEALRHVGVSVMDDQAEIGWPRVSARCDYQAPVYFEEELTIEVHVTTVGTKSVTYGFDFRCIERKIAQGQITAVCCRMGADQKLAAIPIPPATVEKLRRLT